ncbi:6-hydroxymethylpterin diphosphokinase MptE-like protein [Desulfuromonas sp. CSMB_57]|uniref:motility associated factor glycosyltransferase family protein n=1 Tax=Desulfuromonas sp. CSMB_57 TaxID=2807629 RepID=UPI001CD590C1
MESIAPNDLGPIVSNEFGDRYLFSINRYTFRQTDAHTLYKKQYGDGIFQENTLHILVGMDSGLLLQYLHRIGISPTSRYVIVELPKTLERLRQEGLLDASHERVACVTVDELPAIAKKFEFANYLYTEKINIWKSFAALDAFLPEYAELHFAARDFIEAFAWQIKIQLGNDAFIARQLENLADNRHSASCLIDLFAGKTAVLLAGGPSLDHILPWVQEHRSQLVVLAVSRIARRLKDVGLIPDIFFSIDPQEASYEVSKEMLFGGERTLFVNSYHVVPRLLSQWQGPSVFVGPRWPWPDDADEIYLDTPGPTVTNTAFAVAVEMGFSQIILGGVDLCFSPQGDSHALGSYERQAGPQFALYDTQVETNLGQKAFTTRAMAEAVTSFAHLATMALEKGCRTINPAPTAAIIQNVEHLSLDNLSWSPLEQPAWEIITQALPYEDCQTRIAYYKNTLEKLNIAEKAVKKIKKLAQSGLKFNDGLFGRKGIKSDFKYKYAMEKIEDTLQHPSFINYATVLKKVGLQHFIKIARPDQDKEWNDRQIEETGRIYYKAYEESAETMLQYLTLATHRLQLRLAEENPDSVPSSLFKAWEKGGEIGRILIWKNRCGKELPNESDEISLRIKDLESRFRKSLTEKAEYLAAGSKAGSSPEIAHHRIRSLFNHRDNDTLSGLVKGMEGLEQEEMKPVYFLSSGFLAELEGDYATALEKYQKTLELDSNSIKEDALKRIASLSLKLEDLDNSFLALDCLTNFSPLYFKQYGDLAKIMGKTHVALDAYADYLEHFPNDSVVLLKVGQLYQQAGENRFASTIYEHLLKIDPHNSIAKEFLATMN